MGEHIGINNVIQRLRMLYGEEHNILFHNELNGGAIVELIIPYQISRE